MTWGGRALTSVGGAESFWFSVGGGPRKMRWSRTVVNFCFDAFALTTLLAVLWTRMAMFVVLPPPTAGGPPTALWGGTYADWDRINFCLTMGFAVVVLVHLILHWTWISQFVHQRVMRYTGGRRTLDSGTQTIYGVAFMIAVFTVFGGLLLVAAAMAKPG